MAQTHLERLRELRQWQAEKDRELARRCPVPSERGAQADPCGFIRLQSDN